MGVGRDIAYGVGLAALSPVWATSMLRTGKWRSDWAGRLGRVQAKPQAAGKPRLLIHAVSVGETNLVRELVAQLDAAGIDVVVAVTTNTGFERATKLYGEKHLVVRYPLDFSAACARFLEAVKPDAAALVELEVWPNFIDACEARGIPVCVINGRLSERSFRGYRRIRPLLRGTFAKLAAAAVQTQAYAERFRHMGVPAERVRVLDTMKWDTAQIADTVAGAEELAAEMGIDRTRPLIVAGSTAPDETELLLRKAMSRAPVGTQVLIAPRKPEWFEDVMRHESRAVRRTLHQSRAVSARSATAPTRPGSVGGVFLLDTIGELKKAYALADLVIVGRSFGKLYGSDMMEPIALGKPTIVGPRYSDFRDTVEALQAERGIVVSQPQDLAANVARLLTNREEAAELARRGRGVILSRQGSTARHRDLLLELLSRKRH